MIKIKIIETPPGPAPLDIRQEWVGVEMFAVVDDGNKGPRTSHESDGGYEVLTQIAIDALRAKGRHRAASFWECIPLAESLIFHKDACEEVEMTDQEKINTTHFADVLELVFDRIEDSERVAELHRLIELDTSMVLSEIYEGLCESKANGRTYEEISSHVDLATSFKLSEKAQLRIDIYLGRGSRMN